jgi:type II secretion system protein C
MERLAALGIVLLVAGLGAGVYLALGPGPDRAPAGVPVAVSPAPEGPSGPLSESDLKVLWEGFDPKRSVSALLPLTPQGPAVPFTIQGIIYSADGDSVAFVKAGSKVQLCRAGDVIDGWTVKAIEPGRVLFDKDGRELALVVGGRTYPAGGAPSMVALASPAVRPGRNTPPPADPSLRRRYSPPAPRPVGTQGTMPLPTAEERAAVDGAVGLPSDLADMARNNPSTVMNGVTLEPHMVDKQMRGITIAQVAKDSFAARYGLAPGDRVLAVNGEPLDSAGRVYQLYNRYRHDNSVRVTIERAGQVKDVLYYVR